jgi:hypothetical protein
MLGFDYYSEKGCANRVIEPYFITFKWSAWYVFGYCADKGDFRLVKLNRLWNPVMLDASFAPRMIPEDETALDDYFEDSYIATVLFDRSVEYLIVEEYGPDSYETTPDGRLKLTLRFTNDKFIKRWILGFGDKAVLLEPHGLAGADAFLHQPRERMAVQVQQVVKVAQCVSHELEESLAVNQRVFCPLTEVPDLLLIRAQYMPGAWRGQCSALKSRVDVAEAR